MKITGQVDSYVLDIDLPDVTLKPKPPIEYNAWQSEIIRIIVENNRVDEVALNYLKAMFELDSVQAGEILYGVRDALRFQDPLTRLKN